MIIVFFQWVLRELVKRKMEVGGFKMGVPGGLRWRSGWLWKVLGLRVLRVLGNICSSEREKNGAEMGLGLIDCKAGLLKRWAIRWCSQCEGEVKVIFFLVIYFLYLVFYVYSKVYH